MRKHVPETRFQSQPAGKHPLGIVLSEQIVYDEFLLSVSIDLFAHADKISRSEALLNHVL